MSGKECCCDEKIRVVVDVVEGPDGGLIIRAYNLTPEGVVEALERALARVVRGGPTASPCNADEMDRAAEALISRKDDNVAQIGTTSPSVWRSN